MTDTLRSGLSPLQLRVELESMVLKELLGPGSPEEEIIESPGIRYFVGVLAPRKMAKWALGLPRLPSCHPRPPEVLVLLLKLNHERYAEEVKQGLHEKKKPKATKGKKQAKANTDAEPSLFYGEEDA